MADDSPTLPPLTEISDWTPLLVLLRADEARWIRAYPEWCKTCHHLNVFHDTCEGDYCRVDDCLCEAIT